MSFHAAKIGLGSAPLASIRKPVVAPAGVICLVLATVGRPPDRDRPAVDNRLPRRTSGFDGIVAPSPIAVRLPRKERIDRGVIREPAFDGQNAALRRRFSRAGQAESLKTIVSRSSAW
jgi:hypothetical protein